MRYFNPRSQCRERPLCSLRRAASPRFQSTLPMQGATSRDHRDRHIELISIHAPNAGSDYYSRSTWSTMPVFQSTLPMQGATTCVLQSGWLGLFQSTLPMQGATRPIFMAITGTVFQSTLPMQGATRLSLRPSIEDRFQSTLPMQGATRSARRYTRGYDYFNPRSQCRERRERRSVQAQRHISIHAPNAGSDGIRSTFLKWITDFNPRSQCRERLDQRHAGDILGIFQSTLPMQGAT